MLTMKFGLSLGLMSVALPLSLCRRQTKPGDLSARALISSSWFMKSASCGCEVASTVTPTFICAMCQPVMCRSPDDCCGNHRELRREGQGIACLRREVGGAPAGVVAIGRHVEDRRGGEARRGDRQRVLFHAGGVLEGGVDAGMRHD